MASFPTVENRAIQATAPGQQVPEDDESEWEYEYSTTETETFYVTLDLSLPEFVEHEQRGVISGRTSYFRQIEPNEDEDEDGDEDEDELDGDEDELEDGDEDESEDEEEESEDSDHESVTLGDENDESRLPLSESDTGDEVQILELHSANPIISYRGHVYEGQWSENLGTELLLTRHDDKNPLPALRQLGGGVDLLAASSARIVVKSELEVRERERGTKRRRAISYYSDSESTTDESDDSDEIVPDPDYGAGRRFRQGEFLKRLINAKRDRGETDEVTVIAQACEFGKGRRGKRRHGRKRRRIGNLFDSNESLNSVDSSESTSSEGSSDSSNSEGSDIDDGDEGEDESEDENMDGDSSGDEDDDHGRPADNIEFNPAGLRQILGCS